MKVRSIHLDPNDDNVVSVDANLTIDELGLMYRVFGSVSQHAVAQASGSGSMSDALDEICTAIVGVVNRFYENGIDDVAPHFSADRIVDEQRKLREST